MYYFNDVHLVKLFIKSYCYTLYQISKSRNFLYYLFNMLYPCFEILFKYLFITILMNTLPWIDWSMMHVLYPRISNLENRKSVFSCVLVYQLGDSLQSTKLSLRYMLAGEYVKFRYSDNIMRINTEIAVLMVHFNFPDKRASL